MDRNNTNSMRELVADSVISIFFTMSERKREEVSHNFQSALRSASYGGPGSEKNKIKELVRVILFYENPRLEDRYLMSQPSLRKPSLCQKTHYQIDEVYESMRRKYGF